MENIEKFELIPESEVENEEEYDDPFASEKEDSINEPAENKEDYEELNEIKVYAPIVHKDPVILEIILPCSIKTILENLKEEIPAAFDSQDEFIGRIYIEGELKELMEEGDGVVIMINDLLKGKGGESEFIEEVQSSEISAISENAMSENSDISDKPEKSDLSDVSDPTTIVPSSTNPSKSLMSRFKSFWTSEKTEKQKQQQQHQQQPLHQKEYLNIESLARKDENSVPYFIEDVLNFMKSEDQIQEGIFRLSGNFSRIQNVQERFNSGERLKEMNLTSGDCHNVASLLKQFLRNLSEPLLTFDLYDAWKSLGGWTESSEISCNISRFLVNKLPSVNKLILKELMKFLYSRLNDSEITRMNACNYGTVIGPNLLWHRKEDRQTRNSSTLALSLQSTTLASQICTHFLLNYEEIFLKNENITVVAYGRALYDFEENGLSIKDNAIIFITGIEDNFDGWWNGYVTHRDNSEYPQKFPSNYVKVEGQLEDQEIIESILKKIQINKL